MKCGTCGKCRECGSGVVWTGLSPAGNANAAAMNHVYHVINNDAVQAPSIHVDLAAGAAAAMPSIQFVYSPGTCTDCAH